MNKKKDKNDKKGKSTKDERLGVSSSNPLFGRGV
jgi:hypothetical protein